MGAVGGLEWGQWGIGIGSGGIGMGSGGGMDKGVGRQLESWVKPRGPV